MQAVDASEDLDQIKAMPFENLMRIGYERLSKDKSGKSINVNIQRAEIDEYADDTGEAIDRHFWDNDISASELSSKPRVWYPKMIEFIKTGVVYEILVTEISRLTRQNEEGAALVKLRKTTPLRYVTTTDGARYDFHTPRGRKTFFEAVNDAQFESEQTSVRQGRKKNKQAEAGLPHGGQRAYGYEGAKYEWYETPDNEPVRGVLLNPGRVGRTIIEAEAEIRREGTRRMIAGERQTDVVRDLNRRGVPAPEGGQWRLGNFKIMLLNKRAVAFDVFPGPGTRVHKGQEYRGTWPAIVSKEDYELLVTAFRMLKLQRKGGMPNGRQHLLSGIVRCGHDGRPMYGNARTIKGKRQIRYVCRKFDNYGNQVGCGKMFRIAEPVDMLVVEAVLYRLDTPEVQVALAPREQTDRATALVDTVSRQRRKLTDLAAEYGADKWSSDEYVVMKTAAQAVLAESEAELNKIQSQRVAATLPTNQPLHEVWPRLSLQEKRNIILLVVDHVVIHPGHPGTHTWRGFRFNPSSVEIVWRRLSSPTQLSSPGQLLAQASPGLLSPGERS